MKSKGRPKRRCAKPTKAKATRPADKLRKNANSVLRQVQKRLREARPP